MPTTDMLDEQKKSSQQNQYSPSQGFAGQPLIGMPSMSTSQPGSAFPTAQMPGQTKQTAATGGWTPTVKSPTSTKPSGWSGYSPSNWGNNKQVANPVTGVQAAQAAQISPEGMALLKDSPELAAWMQQRSDAEALAKREGLITQGTDMLAQNEADVGLPTSYWNNTAIKAQGAVNKELLGAKQALAEQFRGRENSAVYQRRLAELEDDYRNRAVAATTQVEQQRREMNEAAKLARANQYGTYAGLMPTEGTEWTKYGSYVSGGSPAEKAALSAQRMSSALGGARAMGGGGGGGGDTTPDLARKYAEQAGVSGWGNVTREQAQNMIDLATQAGDEATAKRIQGEATKKGLATW